MLEDIIEARTELQRAERAVARRRKHRDELIVTALGEREFSERAIAVAAGLTRPMLYKIKNR